MTHKASFHHGAASLTMREGSESILVNVSGHYLPDARYVPHVRRYTWQGFEYGSRRALAEAVAKAYKDRPFSCTCGRPFAECLDANRVGFGVAGWHHNYQFR